MEAILDILRRLRNLMNALSTAAVGGVHVDWLFHLLGAAGLVLLLSRRWDPRRAVRWTAGLIVAKELFDLLAKTRLEYIRPPTLDLASDLTAGTVGLAAGVLAARRLGWPPPRRRRRRRSGLLRRHHQHLFQRCLACRGLALLAASALLLVLALGVLSPASAGARPLLAAAGLALLALFAWPGARPCLAWLLPLGPILDFPLLTPGRGIYTVELLGGAAACWWLARLAAGRRRAVPRPDTPVVLWSAFAVTALLALVVGHPDLLGTFAGWRAVRSLLLAGLLGWVLRDLLADPDRDRSRLLARWLGAWCAGVLLLAAGGVAEAVATGFAAEPGSFYRGSVGLAVHLAWSLPLVFLLALEDPDRRRRRLAVAAAAAGLLCLPLTASRGAIGSVLVTGGALLARAWWRSDRRRRVAIAAAVAVVAALGAVVATHPDLAGESFAYKWRATLSGDLFSTRREAWQAARAAIRARPFTGEEPGAWAPAIPLELARRHGLPAMLLALAALLTAAGAALQRTWSGRRKNADTSVPTGDLARLAALGAGMGLLGLLLAGLAETGLGARSLPLVTMLLVLAGADGVALKSTGHRRHTDRIIDHARNRPGTPEAPPRL